MKTFLVPITLFLTITGAFARLGETPDQCQMRYGTSNGQKGVYALYYKDHFDIAVLFRDGKSIEETFAANSAGAFSDEQIAEFLTANAAGSTWYLQSGDRSAYRVYGRRDRGARATFRVGAWQLTITETVGENVHGKQPASGF